MRELAGSMLRSMGRHAMAKPLRLCVLAASLAVAGCTAYGGGASDAGGEGLADSRWQLVEFQSMSDEVGTIRPADAAAFTMTLSADGTVSMRLDCNRAGGTWKTEPGDDPARGGFTFGPLATTRALCPPPHLDERVARDSAWVRSYVLEGDRLYLALMADGGIYVWQRVAFAPGTT